MRSETKSSTSSLISKWKGKSDQWKPKLKTKWGRRPPSQQPNPTLKTARDLSQIPTTTLLHLPLKLRYEIGEYLRPVTRVSLRLTCKDLSCMSLDNIHYLHTISDDHSLADFLFAVKADLPIRGLHFTAPLQHLVIKTLSDAICSSKQAERVQSGSRILSDVMFSAVSVDCRRISAMPRAEEMIPQLLNTMQVPSVTIEFDKWSKFATAWIKRDMSYHLSELNLISASPSSSAQMGSLIPALPSKRLNFITSLPATLHDRFPGLEAVTEQDWTIFLLEGADDRPAAEDREAEFCAYMARRKYPPKSLTFVDGTKRVWKEVDLTSQFRGRIKASQGGQKEVEEVEDQDMDGQI